MPPSATVLFIAEEDPSVAVLSAHLLALASQDRLRTAAVTLAQPRPVNMMLLRLLSENQMPHWWLPQPMLLCDLPAELAGADVAVLLGRSLVRVTRAAVPRACITDWGLPSIPEADPGDLESLFDWRRLYNMVAQRISLIASLSPQALYQLHADPAAAGRSLRM